MKHCPECNRNYADPTLSYCLDDGAALIYGQAIEEPPTAVLSGDPPSEPRTRQIDPHATAPTEVRLARSRRRMDLHLRKFGLGWLAGWRSSSCLRHSSPTATSDLPALTFQIK